MKKSIINTIAAVAVLAGLVCSTFAPWWAVWFILLLVIYGGAVTLIKVNTNNIEYYG